MAMEPAQKAVLEMIETHGGKLARTGNHFVYKFPDGKIFTVSKTPSDHRGWLNCLSDLKRILGIRSDKKDEPAERIERPSKPGLQDSSSRLRNLPDTTHVRIASVHEAFQELLQKFENQQPKIKRTHRMPSERHGEVRRVPSHVLNEVNYLSKLWGEEVGQKYLQDYLDEQNFGSPNVFKKKEEPQESEANMSESLEAALKNAQQNLANLHTEIANLEQKAEECKRSAQVRKEQIGAIEEAISSLQLTIESFKKAGPALRGILPTDTKPKSRRGGAVRGLRPNMQKAILAEAQKHFPTGPFTALQLWAKLEHEPGWEGLKKSSVYSALSQHCKGRGTQPAPVKRVGDALYEMTAAAPSVTVAA